MFHPLKIFSYLLCLFLSLFKLQGMHFLAVKNFRTILKSYSKRGLVPVPANVHGKGWFYTEKFLIQGVTPTVGFPRKFMQQQKRLRRQKYSPYFFSKHDIFVKISFLPEICHESESQVFTKYLGDIFAKHFILVKIFIF